MGNACGCPPTMELVRRGILTGLGTDGYTHDMTESFKVANVLHKHHLCDANEAWTEVPKMLFENNARIANRYFKTPLGVLKEGAAADVIVVDYDPPTQLRCTGRCFYRTVISCLVLVRLSNGRSLRKNTRIVRPQT
ncbi:5'-deoxyadenosine deaminase [Eubacterium plexicaudatum ASF492]|uniref:Uncharacterized protein n=1 Tax=Eubacterium plexicaudatum ASF492 TaxID=1235802 RepID=N2A9X7_9FIRM|nr:5'-deoxyadenosine deaminase [Eubacterium plexicaudatum ASF492]